MTKKTTQKITLSILAFAIVSFMACSKDNKNNSPATSHKLVYKAEASAGSNINISVYGYDATLTTASALSGTTWTSPEITAPANSNVATIMVNAMGVNISSTLKVQIFVDGVLKKEGTSTGTALSATAQYNLR